MRRTLKFEQFVNENYPVMGAPAPAKPDTRPATRPGTSPAERPGRPSAIPSKRPSVDPAPKAELDKKKRKISEDEVADMYLKMNMDRLKRK
jgi:hypothetical protein